MKQLGEFRANSAQRAANGSGLQCCFCLANDSRSILPAKESKLVAAESMRVLNEFEGLDDAGA